MSYDVTLVSNLQKISQKISAVVVTIGILVLLGWVLDIPLLKSVLPGLVTMKANTALGFVAAGSALWLWHHPSDNSSRQNWAKYLSWGVLILGFLTLCQYLLGLDFQIDELLFKDTIDAVGTAYPGRMGLNTAFNFLLLGLALLLCTGSSINYQIAQMLSVAAFLVAFVGFLGYAYSVQSLYGIASYTQMALHTSITFIILSTGILLAQPDRGFVKIITSKAAGGLMLRRLLPAILLVPALIGWFVLYIYRDQDYTLELGLCIQTVLNTTLFAGMISWNANLLNQLDQERISNENKLRSREEQLRLFIKFAPAALAMFDDQMRYILASQRWLNDYKLGDIDIEGQCHYEIFPEVSEDWKQIHRECLAGAVRYNEEEAFPRADGHTDWVKWEIRPWYEGAGEIGGLIIITEVISERKQAQEELKTLAAELEQRVETRTNELSEINQRLQAEIEDRAKAERQLQESGTMLQLVMDNIPQGIFWKDQTGVFLGCNQAFANMLGITVADICGKTESELPWKLAHTQGEYLSDQQIIATQKPIYHQVELWEIGNQFLQQDSGQALWIDLNKIPLIDIDGKVRGVLSTLEDITERKNLSEFQARMTAILEATTDFVVMADAEGNIIYVNRAVRTLLNQENSQEFNQLHISDLIPPDQRDAFLQGPMTITRHQRIWRGEGVLYGRDGASIPVSQVIVAHQGATGEVQFISTIARDISERKQAEEERSTLISILESSKDFIGIASLDGRPIYGNQAAMEIVGLDNSEAFKSIYMKDFFMPEYLPLLQTEIIPTVLKTGFWQGELEFRHFQTGQAIPVEYSIFTLKKADTDEVSALGTITRNIKDRKRAAQELAASEEQLRQQTQLLQLILNNMRDGVIFANAQGELSLLNRAAEAMFGSINSQTQPNQWSEKYGLFLEDTVTPYPPDQVPLARALSGEIVDNATLFARHAGQPEGRFLAVNALPLKNEQGILQGGMVVYRDITEEREAQANLERLAQEQTRLLQEIKNRQNSLDEAAIVSETDLKGMLTYVNHNFCKISGYSQEELLGKNHRIINSGYHPQEFFQEMWTTISRGFPWKGEICNRRKDGSFYWVDSTIAPIFDTSGQVIKYIAIRYDITERKKAEEGLEKVAAERKAEADALTQQVLKLLSEIKGAAQGDLTVKAEVSNDILGAVADSFNFLISSLRKVVNGIQELTNQVTTATRDSVSNTTDLIEAAQVQAGKIEAMIRQLERLISSIHDVRDAATRAEQVAEQASQTAEVGGNAVDKAVDGINTLRQTIGSTAKMMKRLGESSQQIGKIVTSISQIASQTNLLALNATIEAARAGEQGLGFAVVAEEVRKLAERSASATEEISEIVSTIQDEVSVVMKAMEAGTQEVVAGTQLATEAKDHLNAIIEVSREMNALVRNITRAAAKQTASAEEISSSMQQVNEISGSTAEKAMNVEQSLDGLAKKTQQLQGSIANFRS